jgi:hypothetical protein
VLQEVAQLLPGWRPGHRADPQLPDELVAGGIERGQEAVGPIGELLVEGRP